MSDDVTGRPSLASREFNHDGYRQHLAAGGTPFGSVFNATIRETMDTYRSLVMDRVPLTAENEALHGLLADACTALHAISTGEWEATTLTRERAEACLEQVRNGEWA